MTGRGPSVDPTERARLAAVASYDVIDADPSDPTLAELAALCEIATDVTGLPVSVVNIFDDRFQHQVAAFGADPVLCSREESLCRTTLADDHDQVVIDCREDPRLADSPWVTGRLAGLRTYCSVILRGQDGLALGTLCAFDEKVHDVGVTQMRKLRLLSRQVVAVLDLRARTRQLERSNAELTRSQDRLAGFAGQVSHDLKAPITAVIGFSELLADMDTIADDPSAASFVARCESASKRMLAMIEDLLAFARIGGSLHPVPVSLDAVLPDVLADLGTAGADAQVTWSGVDVTADPVQFRALLQNLIGNALAYRGDRPAQVAVVATASAGTTVVEVIDNGPGIPAHSREDVVRPLYRLRKDVSGAGLGLAVCTRVMAAHGGTLRLGDTPGGGTTVTATFPC